MRESGNELSTRLDDLFPGLTNDRARFETVFGPALFIHLSRVDKVSQAVSRVKAVQTGLWHIAADGTERERTGPARAIAYDRDEIARYVEELMAQDESWNNWFASNGIEPLRLTYEALSQDPKGTLATVLAALGLDPAIAARIEPKTARLSDGESQNWVTRFRTETGRPPLTNKPRN
jgi:LPS sulfotransferase NodH